MKARRVVAVVLFIVFAVSIGTTIRWAHDGTWPNSAPAPTGTVPANITSMLDQVRVVDARPNPAGYDRDCGRGHGCVFGAAWTDNSNAPGGHNGCDSRDDVLALQMTDVTFKPRTGACTVLTGTLQDPYTGTSITFRRSNPLEIQIDHLYPLALAWDMGADKWTQQRRTDFANDQLRNLLAVSGKANQSKSDKGPAEWLVPDNPAFRCTYMARYLQVADHYDLPITKADANAIRRGAQGCPAH